MTKEVIEIHIADLIERIQSVDKLINMYKQTEYDAGSIFMIEQHSFRKAEFVERLNILRKKALKLERVPVSKKAYSPEPMSMSFAHEPTRSYGEKSKIDGHSKIE